jgi:hypothetical protein
MYLWAFVIRYSGFCSPEKTEKTEKTGKKA